MDFFNRQPHPETNETACIMNVPDARPLRPAAPEDALVCAAHWDGQYHLALVPAAAPETVVAYSGPAIDALTPEGTVVRLGQPIRRLSFLTRPEGTLLCVHADRVHFFQADGSPVATLELSAASVTAFYDGIGSWLITDSRIIKLTESLTLAQTSAPIRAQACLVPPNRTDVLRQTGRENPGTVGGMCFTHQGRTHYVCGDVFNRCGMRNVDAFICEVYDLARPFSRRYLALPNGGAAYCFVGAGDRVHAAFVGATPLSCVYGKAALLPLDFPEAAFYRPDGAYQLETLPTARLRPRGGIDQIRDSFVLNAPDGYYYLTGTTLRENGTYWSYTNGIRLWRSRDLVEFEPLGTVYDYLDTPDSWQNHVSRGHNCWAPEMIHHGGTFWLTYSTAPGCGLLKSVSGRPEGPYMDMGRVVGKGIDAGFFQENGVLYLIWQNGRIAPLTEDGTSFREEPVLLTPVDGQQVGYEGAGLIRVRDKYVLYAAEWHGDARIDGTYDMMYSVSDRLMGPYCPRRVLVPHGGHGCLFYDKSGQLCYTIFGNDRSAPFRHSVGIGPVNVAEEGESLTLSV